MEPVLFQPSNDVGALRAANKLPLLIEIDDVRFSGEENLCADGVGSTRGKMPSGCVWMFKGEGLGRNGDYSGLLRKRCCDDV